MGIIEQDLAEFGLSAFDVCYIERNADDSIHLHLDALRVEMSRREFDQFAAVVQDASNDLEMIKSNDGTHEDTTTTPR